MAAHTTENRPLGLQIPLLEGAEACIPTKAEVALALGVSITDEIYARLLNELLLNDSRPWQEIIRQFIAEDRTPDHSWAV